MLVIAGQQATTAPFQDTANLPEQDFGHRLTAIRPQNAEPEIPPTGARVILKPGLISASVYF